MSSFRRFEDEPTRLSSPLDRLAKQLGVTSARSGGRLFEGWAEIVGDVVAAHAKPLSLRDGVLVLGVDHGAWATSLRHLETTLRAQLDDALGAGTVQSIEVRVRPDLHGRERPRSGGRNAPD